MPQRHRDHRLGDALGGFSGMAQAPAEKDADRCRRCPLTLSRASALIAPWTVRNSLVPHSFVPLAVGNGQVLVGAYNNTVLTEQNYLGLWTRLGAGSLRITIPPCQDYTACEVAHDDAETDAELKPDR